jgi:hypothetical protein
MFSPSKTIPSRATPSKSIKACGIVVTAFLLSAPVTAQANDSGIGIGLRHMQKLWNGILEKPRMTTCRLATRQTVKAKQICVYAGANRTFVAIYNDAGTFCAGEMQCRYDPDRNKSVSGYVVAFRNAQRKNK